MSGNPTQHSGYRIVTRTLYQLFAKSIIEFCGNNVSETSRRLGMHRRTLQRILAKHAPR